MEKKEMIYIASKAADKGTGFEDLGYGDDMYGREKYTEDVWEYVEEYKEMGSTAFREKYKEYDMY